MPTQYEEEYKGYRNKFGGAYVAAYTYAVSNITLYFPEQTKLYIGRFCSIAQGLCVILGGNHPLNQVSTYPLEYVFPETPSLKGIIKRDVIIENDVWIGIGVHIMPGVHVGNGAVIGAFSVVTKDVPPYAVVAGNPATIKKFRFPEDIINRLLKLEWWNWPKEKLRSALPLLNSTNIEDFLIYHETKKNNPVKYYTGEEQ